MVLLSLFLQSEPPRNRAEQERLTLTDFPSSDASASDARNREIASWYIGACVIDS